MPAGIIPKLGLDLDGVILDHTKNKILLAKKFGFSLKPAETSSSRMKRKVPLAAYHEIQKILYGELSLSAPPVEGALKGLQTLSERYDLSIISRRNDKEVALAWVRKRLNGLIKESNIFFVMEDHEKDSICEELGIDIFLDDKIESLWELKTVKERFWFDRFNVSKEYADLGGIKVISSWEDFVERIGQVRLFPFSKPL